MNTLTLSLSEMEQKRFRDHVEGMNYIPKEVPHSRMAVKKPGLSLVLYNSGKLVAQGKGLKEWIEFTLEPEIIQRPCRPAETDSPEVPSGIPEACIGIDESGKGDFFGPMVVAAYHVPPGHYKGLLRLGVRDSKKISSDKKIREISGKLLAKTPAHCEVLVLSPSTYNTRVKKFGSVNRLLAWAHAAVLENLLERFPETRLAVADQFGPEHQIRQALREKGKKIRLEQRHRAESDPSVAAASILARDRFVRELEQLSREAGVALPKGATHVRPVAETLVASSGPECLIRFAKTHFRTTRQVLESCGYDPATLGTPEPAKSSAWKKNKADP